MVADGVCRSYAPLAQVAFDGSGPAYRLLEAMGSVLEHEGCDSFRGAPRLVFALLMHLQELSVNAERDGVGRD